MLHLLFFYELQYSFTGRTVLSLKISVIKYGMGIEGFRVGCWIITPFFQIIWLKCYESDKGSRGKSY